MRNRSGMGPGGAPHADVRIETSVWVVTDDHPPDLARYVRALLDQQEAGPYEVVLVDVVGSVDYAGAFAAAAAELASAPPYRVLQRPGAGRATGYNAAWEAADPDAPLTIFFADDFIAPGRLVSAHRAYHRAHAEDEAVGIGAALLPPHHADDPFARWLEASGELYGTSFHAGMERVPEDFFYVGNASVKRALLERAGRFDDRFAGHAVDDYELGLRLSAQGMRAGYVPEALAIHEHPLSLRERCETMRRAGEAARVFEASHGVPAAWRHALGQPPWRHRWDALRHRIGHGLTRSPRQRARYYRSRLRASLSAGYRSAPADA